MSLDVDIKKKLAYFAKQVEFLDKLLDYKIARLPKHFHPYANLHFRKAYDEKLLSQWKIITNTFSMYFTVLAIANECSAITRQGKS
jgi:hypothetical protein